MKKKKILLKILAVVLIVIIGTALYAFREFYRKPKDLTELKPKYTVNAIDFIKEFGTDDKKADAKYLDKVIEVNGIVKEIKKDENGFYTIALGDAASMSSVRCSMDSLHNNELQNIAKGNNLSVKGVCTGYNAEELLGSDVILNRGVNNNKN